METKPFSIQSPEQIAKDYAGNKQMIAHAAQSGLLDPTAAVLAGMFIDRAHGSQAMGQPQQQTVAQQVFAPPMQQAPMMGGQAPMMGGQAPGMSMGGLTTLDVPESVFDEPDDAGHAGGGIVSFASGSSVDANTVYKLDDGYFDAYGHHVSPRPGQTVVEGESSPALWGPMIHAKKGATPTKIPAIVSRETPPPAPTTASYDPEYTGPINYAFAPAAAPALTPPAVGIGTLPAAQPAMTRPPAPPPQRSAGLGATASAFANMPSIPEDTSIPVPLPQAAPDLNATLQQLQGMVGSGGPATDAYKAYLEDTTQRQASQKKEDLWSTLAQIGFGMAGSNSPYALQAAGQAASAAMPGVQKAIEARRAEQEQSTKDLMGLETQAHSEKVQEVNMALNQFDTAIKAASDAGQLQQAAQIANQRNEYERRAQDMGLIEHREENRTQVQVAGINAGAGAAAARGQLSAANEMAAREKADAASSNFAMLPSGPHAEEYKKAKTPGAKQAVLDKVYNETLSRFLGTTPAPATGTATSGWSLLGAR